MRIHGLSYGWGRLGMVKDSWGRLGMVKDGWGRLGMVGDSWGLVGDGSHELSYHVRGSPRTKGVGGLHSHAQLCILKILKSYKND
jgi:hypothetical protein